MSYLPTDHSRILDSLFVHACSGEFNGMHAGTEVDASGAIVLGAARTGSSICGTYTSQVIATLPFRQLVMSWNAETPAGTYVELEARVLRADQVWSEWMSWGKWGRTIVCSSADSNDDIARMDADTLTVHPDGVEAVALQYRVSLHSSYPSATPTVRLVAGTMSNDIPGHQLTKTFDQAAVQAVASIDLPVPQYSQYKRDPQFAHGICSPTCLTMAMEYFGRPVLVEEVVRAAWDEVYGGYGNWSFNVAVAGSYGFSAYVASFWSKDSAATLDLVSLFLAEGKPIIASVRYRNSPEVERNLPVLEGAPIARTAGHLVLIRGITERDGVTYLIVNDPAAAEDATVRHEYRADQFLNAWVKRIAYVIEPRRTGDEGAAAPLPRKAVLEPTGNTRENDGLQEFEYELKDVGKNRISLSNNGSRHHICIACRKASEPIQYIAPSDEDTLWLTREFIDAAYEFTFLFNAGKVYHARMA